MANAVRQAAYDAGSTDNIAVVAVRLNGGGSLPSAEPLVFQTARQDSSSVADKCGVSDVPRMAQHEAGGSARASSGRLHGPIPGIPDVGCAPMSPAVGDPVGSYQLQVQLCTLFQLFAAKPMQAGARASGC